MHKLEHKTRLAGRLAIRPAPFTFGSPIRESLRKPSTYDPLYEQPPSRISDAQRVRDAAAEIQALGEDCLQPLVEPDRWGTRDE